MSVPKVLLLFLIGFIILAVGQRAMAQNELDDLMNNASKKDSAGVVIPDRGPASAEGADWFAQQVEAVGSDEAEKKWVEQLRRIAAMKGEQQIADMKKLVLQKFGIVVFGAGSEESKIQYDKGDERQYWKLTSWTIEQLQTVYETLDAMPEGFRKMTKRIAKYERKVSGPKPGKNEGKYNYGYVQHDNPDTVYVFDAMFKGKYEGSEKGKAVLTATLAHEMTHCFQLGQGSELQDRNPDQNIDAVSALGKWSTMFWASVSFSKDYVPVPEGHKGEKKVRWDALTLGREKLYWERGIPVSIYGGPTQRQDPGLDNDLWIGSEDMAEANAFAFCAPDLMEKRYPKRFSEITRYCRREKGDGVPDVKFNPRWYGFSETEIVHILPDGEYKLMWADVGADGSKPESYGDGDGTVMAFVNCEEKPVHTLKDDNTLLLKDHGATIGRIQP